MYNAEVKNEYIMSGKGYLTQRELLAFFKKLAPIEMEYGKDISLFDLEESKDAIIKTEPRNEKQAKVRCSFINGYRKWIYKNDEHLFKDMEPDFYSQFN